MRDLLRAPTAHLCLSAKNKGRTARYRTSRRQTRVEIPLLADLIETVPDAMAITDVDGRMRRINQSWLDLFGYPADDCIGQGPIMVLQPGATPSVDWMRAGFTPNGNGSAPATSA